MNQFQGLGVPNGPGGGGFRSVQRGVAGGAGTITIGRVDMSKTMVISVSKGSAGTVAATGSLTVTATGNTGTTTSPWDASSVVNVKGAAAVYPPFAGSLSGGTTSLTTAQYSARLTSSTTIVVDGACEWQVVESN